MANLMEDAAMPAVLAPVPSCLAEVLKPEFEVFVTRAESRSDLPGGMGEMEEGLSHDVLEMQRLALERGAQAKADGCDNERCRECGCKLSKVSHGHERTIRTRFGNVTLRRTKGYCSKCSQWRFPADDLWGLDKRANASPSLQEASALLVSKMPAEEAARVLERLTGRPCDDSTMARECRRAGDRAQAERRKLDEKACSVDGRWDVTGDLHSELGPAPFSLVIEMDAWLIRERDGWGDGKDAPSRWHWVYTATVFRLDQRAHTQSDRPMILSRGYVATRQGITEFSRQVYAEAVRHGMLLAQSTLVIADGGVWIWKIAEDRFSHARKRLDFYHASQHLWALANEQYGVGTPQARAWVEPLLHQLRHGGEAGVLQTLEDLAQTVDESMREAAQRESNYFQSHKDHLDYAQGCEVGEPIGSGAIESTCRQYQCRFKRPGQFWTIDGDEALLTLETFWRNGRWATLFPHAVSKTPLRT